MQPENAAQSAAGWWRSRSGLRFAGAALLLAVVASVILTAGERTPVTSTGRLRLVVLGFDGLDAHLTEKWMAEGALPNFERLRSAGAYRRLRTTNPAESPVAWSVFLTGVNPGRTGILGFLRRDPTSYRPYFAPTAFQSGRFLWNWFPLRRPSYVNRRAGVPFWKRASQAGVKATVLFCPETFPPAAFDGHLLSGPEAPDLLGTAGSFAFYSTDPSRVAAEDNSGRVLLVEFENNVAETILRGPRDWTDPESGPLSVPLRLKRVSAGVLEVEVQGERVRLAEGKWSPWLTLEFTMTLWTKPRGIARFYLQQIKPELQLYLSPINIDPRRPAFRISHPSRFAGELAEDVGLYKTIGWGADTWALNDGFLDDAAFLEDARQTFAERRRILLRALGSGDVNLVVTVFNSTDRVQHMFWGKENGAEDAIRSVYQLADSVVGEVLDRVGTSAIVMVVSDHGFVSYRKSVNLNRWLYEKGSLAVKGGRSGGRQTIDWRGRQAIDWSATKAYSVGLSGVYVNVRGRERDGVVAAGESYDRLRQEIRNGLLQWIDPASGERLVEEVYLREETYSGPYARDAPDLVVALRPGYRVSQRSSLGSLEPEGVTLNHRKWSGDHVSVDPKFVPGVFLVNRPLVGGEEASILDLAPTILGRLGLPRSPDLEGRDLFELP